MSRHHYAIAMSLVLALAWRGSFQTASTAHWTELMKKGMTAEIEGEETPQ